MCVTSTSNDKTFQCRIQGTNCSMKWDMYVIICYVCGMQYVCQTSNIRSRMNGHISDYRRFLNGDFSKSDTSSPCSHFTALVVNIFKFQMLEILENDGFKYVIDIRQL